MPWLPGRKWKHSKKARTAKDSRQAAHVANSVLERTGDEGRAVAAANSVLKKKRHKKRHGRSSSRS